jgi:hypothetical protein
MKTESSTRRVLIGQRTLAAIKVIESVTSFLRGNDDQVWFTDGEFDFDETSNKSYTRVTADVRIEKKGNDCRRIRVEFLIEQQLGFNFGPNAGRLYWSPLVSSGLVISHRDAKPLQMHFYECGTLVGGDGTVGFAKQAEKFRQALFPA